MGAQATGLLRELRELIAHEEAGGDGSYARDIRAKFTQLDTLLSGTVSNQFLPDDWYRVDQPGPLLRQLEADTVRGIFQDQ